MIRIFSMPAAAYAPPKAKTATQPLFGSMSLSAPMEPTREQTQAIARTSFLLEQFVQNAPKAVVAQRMGALTQAFAHLLIREPGSLLDIYRNYESDRSRGALEHAIDALYSHAARWSTPQTGV